MRRLLGARALILFLVVGCAAPQQREAVVKPRLTGHELAEFVAYQKAMQTHYAAAVDLVARLLETNETIAEYGGRPVDGPAVREEVTTDFTIVREQLAKARSDYRNRMPSPPIFSDTYVTTVAAEGPRLIEDVHDLAESVLENSELWLESALTGDKTASVANAARLMRLTSELIDIENRYLEIALVALEPARPSHGLTRAMIESNRAAQAINSFVADCLEGKAFEFQSYAERGRTSADLAERALDDAQKRTDEIRKSTKALRSTNAVAKRLQAWMLRTVGSYDRAIAVEREIVDHLRTMLASTEEFFGTLSGNLNPVEVWQRFGPRFEELESEIARLGNLRLAIRAEQMEIAAELGPLLQN